MMEPKRVDDQDGLVRSDYPEINLGFFLGDEPDPDEFDDVEYDPFSDLDDDDEEDYNGYEIEDDLE